MRTAHLRIVSCGIPCLGLGGYPPLGHISLPPDIPTPDISIPQTYRPDIPTPDIPTPGHPHPLDIPTPWTYPPPRRDLVLEIATPLKGHSTGDTHSTPLWAERHLWKHYLPATSFAGGKDELLQTLLYERVPLSHTSLFRRDCTRQMPLKKTGIFVTVMTVAVTLCKRKCAVKRRDNVMCVNLIWNKLKWPLLPLASFTCWHKISMQNLVNEARY